MSSLTSLAGKHILSIKQFDRIQLQLLFDLTDKCKKLVEYQGCGDCLKDKLMCCLFCEASTRTLCSFQSAMLRLGGKVMSINDLKSTSMTKGESWDDTLKCIDCYSDILIQRHSQVGSALKSSKLLNSSILVNAGDGIGEHPSQTLTDLYTIQKETPLHQIDNLTITLIGDLKNGRTVHSLVQALALFKNVQLNYVSCKHLKMPGDIIDSVNQISKLNKTLVKQTECLELDSILHQTDILYVTRIQIEREQSNFTESPVVIDKNLLTNLKAKPSLKILHPFPRLSELSTDVDEDLDRAVYFKQMKNGMFVRMALLCAITGRQPN